LLGTDDHQFVFVGVGGVEALFAEGVDAGAEEGAQRDGVAFGDGGVQAGCGEAVDGGVGVAEVGVDEEEDAAGA
jgi:hypothetical protein